MNKKFTAAVVSALITVTAFSAQGLSPITAKQAAAEASKKQSAQESVDYLKGVTSAMTNGAEKRSLLAFLASVQEQMGLYEDARNSYAAAAGIAAGDADGMTPKSSEQLVLDAVRCALSSGDSDTADSFLNSAVRNSKDETVQAYIKLYAQWSALCRAESVENLAEPIALLKTYADLPSMISVCPKVLLTVWYLTGDNSYSEKIQKQFPDSPESWIVSGKSYLLPTPFLYFIPHAGEAVPSDESVPETAGISDSSEASSDNKTDGNTAAVSDTSAPKAKKLQLGLFREKANADTLVTTLKQKGFAAYTSSEKRPSGTTYYLVFVDENDKGTVAESLRTAGFECYPVFDN